MEAAIIILIVLSGLAIVPISLARGVIGASWPMIVRAYVIWFGLLILAMRPSLSHNDTALGWTVLIALFLTIPAIFLLSFIQRIGQWMGSLARRLGEPPGRPQAAGGVLLPNGQRDQTAAQHLPWSDTLIGQHWRWLLAGLVFVGAAYAAVHFYDRAALRATAQDLFDLPPTARFAEVNKLRNSTSRRPRFEAVIQLSDVEFSAFVAKRNNHGAWPIETLMFDDQPVTPASADVRRWSEWPEHAASYQYHINAGPLTGRGLADLRSGHVQCYGILRIRPTNTTGRDRRTPARLTAKACAELDKQDRLIATRMAILNTERKTLHLLVR